MNLGSGVANLVLLPIEQYRKDGRLARGLQRGVSAFGRTTTLEALHVGAKLATGTQVILEQAEAVLGARFGTQVIGETLAAERSSGDDEGDDGEEIISRYAEQPTGMREGMEEAYRSLGDNFRSAAQTILAVPMEVYERSGTEVSLLLFLYRLRFVPENLTHLFCNSSGPRSSCRTSGANRCPQTYDRR